MKTILTEKAILTFHPSCKSLRVMREVHGIIIALNFVLDLRANCHEVKCMELGGKGYILFLALQAWP